jgi:Transposase DDE domain
MVFESMLQKFIEKRPITVMLKIVLETVFSAEKFDGIFAEVAREQYTRELTFSTLAKLVSQVTLGPKASVHAAFLQDREQVPVTIGAVYAKLKGVETPVLQRLVDDTSTSLAAIAGHLTSLRVQPVPGYRLKVIDGTVLAGTDHRPAVVRDTNAAALPGMAIAIYDYETGLICHMLPCTDAHTNERRLMTAAADWVQEKDLIMADRNFCTGEFLSAVASRGGAFLVRRHGGTGVEIMSDWRPCGRCRTGSVSEAIVRLSNGLECRAIRIVRDKPLADGGMEVMLLTNLPQQTRAQTLADLYLERWTIEEAFRQLTQYLSCEVKTLGYPEAALFAFTMAVLAHNCLACVRAALASVRGRKRVAEEVSNYHLATEVAASMDGLTVAVDEDVWTQFTRQSPQEIAMVLKEIAGHVSWGRYAKSKRGPQKPITRKKVRRGSHVSTGKLLAEQASNKALTAT